MEISEELQQHIDSLLSEQKLGYETQIETLKGELDKLTPKELTEQEKEIKRLKKELLQQQVTSMLKDNHLSDFSDFIQVESIDDLNNKLDKLKKIVSDRKLSNNFIPQDHKSTDTYEHAERVGDVSTMIQSKLSKLFK